MAIVRRIPDPPEPSLLLYSNIKVGYNLTKEQNIAYRKALFKKEEPEGTTTEVDWLD
jgi:hypothetical protein